MLARLRFECVGRFLMLAEVESDLLRSIHYTKLSIPRARMQRALVCKRKKGGSDEPPLLARIYRVISQPLGSCRMRSPIMFFCTGEVPPAIVIDSDARTRRIQSPSGANGE